ncbi:MAG: hypothetical protein KF893_26225 [Caldilineaceae bacterium]|nr:hypothetical protein [Caldilineaceae bacterium]
MFHQRCNELRLTLRLQPVAPLLVKAGDDPLEYLNQDAAVAAGDLPFAELVQQERKAIADKKAKEEERRKGLKQGRGGAQKGKAEPDMRFVRTWRNGQEEPYLPGSSLKGVLRSRCEQLAVTFGKTDSICNVLDQEGKSGGRSSCTKVIEEVSNFRQRYHQACPVCKLFGCGGLAARLAVSDAYLVTAFNPKEKLPTRSGVGINRQRGAAQTGALFFYEVLEEGAFDLTLTLENFELWQVGLTAYALDDLFNGRLPVGYGARRGLGRLQGKVEAATLTYFGKDAQKAKDGCLLRGIGWLAKDLRQEYNFVDEGDGVILSDATLAKSGLRQTWTLPDAAVEKLWETGAQAWRVAPWMVQKEAAE